MLQVRKMLKGRFPQFFALTILTYISGYFLHALDRTVIYSWINLIHYASMLKILALLFLAGFLAVFSSRIRLDRKHHAAAIVFLAVLSTLPFSGSTQPESDFILYYDAAVFIRQNGFSALNSLSEIGYDDLPALPILHALLHTFFGESHLASETLQRLFYILLPIASYLLFRELFDADSAFYASLLLLATPNILAQNYLFMQDIPATVLILASVFFTLKSFENRIFIPPAVFTIVSALSTKVSAILFITILVPAAIILKSWRGFNPALFKKILPPILITGIIVLSALYSTPSLSSRLSQKTRIIDVEKNISRFFSIGSHIPVSSLPFQLGFPQTILALTGLSYALKNRNSKHAFLLAWILIPFLILHDMRVRYQMPYFPAVSMLAVLGLNSVKDVLTRRRIAYFTVLSMIFITSITAPNAADSHSFKNLQDVILQSNQIPAATLGVYLDFDRPWISEKPLVSATDYYSSKKVIYLGESISSPRTGLRKNYVVPSYYGNLGYGSEIREILGENYMLILNNTFGVRYFHNPHLSQLYALKEGCAGPTELVAVYSNRVPKTGETLHTDFLQEDFKNRNYDQAYSFGPISLASYYGVRREDWLGERILFMKPPEVGQVNQTFKVFVPENSSLKFTVSLRPDTWHYLKGDGVEFIVLMDCDDATEKIFDEYVDPKNIKADRKLHQHEIPLTACHGKKSEITFQTKSGPNHDSKYDTAGFGDPRIVLN